MCLHGVQKLISTSVHLIFSSNQCTNQEFSFPTPSSTLFLVYKLRNLCLYTILGSFLGVQIKKSLSLHHPPRFSWCTNQEISVSTPSPALFFVHKLRNPFLYTILNTFLGVQIKNSLSMHHTPKQQKKPKATKKPKTTKNNKKPPAVSQAFLKLRSRRVVFFILIRPVSYDSSCISFRIHMDMDHLDKSSLQSVPLVHWLQIHLCWYL